MVRKVEVHLSDDIDGTPADETVSFGLDGANYEIDVNAKHAKQLRTALETFVNAARRPGLGRVVATRRTRAVARPALVDKAQNRAIRDWAKRKKIALSDRGRIPRRIVERYEAQAGRLR